MKTIIISFTLFIFITLINPAHSFLYLIHDEALNDNVLFTIDSFNLTETLNYYPGYDLEALDSHPDRWELYAASGDNSENPGYLYRINPQNGNLTKIGSTGFKEIEELSFRDDGTLWAWAKGDGLIKIDPQTAKSELILPSEMEIEAMTWNNKGDLLYLAQGTEIWQYDGQNLEFGCQIVEEPIEAMEITRDDTLLVATHGQSTLLQLSALTVIPCFILKNGEIVSEHNDIEGIAYTEPEPLILWAPTSWPEEVEPNKPTEVRFTIGLSGGTGDEADIPPLHLEEITPAGVVNHIGPLENINNTIYFYAGLYTLNRTVEGEYCYRFRTEGLFAGIELVSDETCLWVVSFPTGDKSWSEEAVMVRFMKDTSVNRIKEIIWNEGATVLNVMPDIKLLLVRIESDTVQNVVTRFEKYDEVKFAMPDFLLEPLTQNVPDSSEIPNSDPEIANSNQSPPEPEPLIVYDFEYPLETTGWTVNETCFTTNQLDQFTATEGDKFLVCTTYPNNKTAFIKREIRTFSDITISFDYNVITQENVATLNDKVRLSLVAPNGQMTPLVANVGELPMFDSTLHLPEGEMAIKQTGWQTASVEIPMTGGSKGFLSIIIHSENDPSIGGEGEGNNLHSAVLVDNIQIFGE